VATVTAVVTAATATTVAIPATVTTASTDAAAITTATAATVATATPVTTVTAAATTKIEATATTAGSWHYFDKGHLEYHHLLSYIVYFSMPPMSYKITIDVFEPVMVTFNCYRGLHRKGTQTFYDSYIKFNEASTSSMSFFPMTT
jgi:hypothetical protein